MNETLHIFAIPGTSKAVDLAATSWRNAFSSAYPRSTDPIIESRKLCPAPTKRFRDLLSSRTDQVARARLCKILITEQDRHGADLELLADVERHVVDSNKRIETRQEIGSQEKTDTSQAGH